ncbi:MAG: hypothetical protein ACOYL3_10495 [Desulfuromonadaceae bacterium]
MTTMYTETVKCRNCGKTNSHIALSSTNSFGFSDLDFRRAGMIRSTMHTWLQLCRYCGNCSPDLSQPATNSKMLKSDTYRQALQRTDIPELARKFLAYAIALTMPRARYGIFAQLLKWGNSVPADPIRGARAYLHTAWCCDDAKLPDQATEFRQLSADWFLKGKPFTNDEQGIADGTILVDVLRRCGRLAEASSECKELLETIKCEGTIHKLLEAQRSLIALKDTALHTVNEPVQPVPPDDFTFGNQDSQFKWWQVSDELNIARACSDAVIELIRATDPPINPKDILCVVETSEIGVAVKNILDAQGVGSIMAFYHREPNTGIQNDFSHKKTASIKVSDRMKITTVNSFRGWMTKGIIVQISQYNNRHRTSSTSLAYDCINELVKMDQAVNMTVVNSRPELAGFGKRWQNFLEYK